MHCSVLLPPVADPALQYFSYYPINDKTFRRVLDLKCVFWFFLQLFYDTFLTLQRILQNIIINVHTSIFEVPVIIVILIKPKFSQQVFEKYSDTKFHENPSSGIQVVPWGQIDRQKDTHGEVNSHISQFCKQAQKLTTRFHITSRVISSTAMLLLPCTPSWCAHEQFCIYSMQRYIKLGMTYNYIKKSLSDIRSNLLVQACSSMADDFYQNCCVTQEI